MSDFRQIVIDKVVSWFLSRRTDLYREVFTHPETLDEVSWLVSQARATQQTHVIMRGFIGASYPLRNPLLLASSINGTMRRIGKLSIVTTATAWDEKHKRVIVTWIPGKREEK